MSETKKYYWLKLHKNFFKRHEIKIIEGMENGKDYVLFYLKLLSESVSHGGKLRFSDEIPYDAQMLSSITNTDLNVVKTAMFQSTFPHGERQQKYIIFQNIIHLCLLIFPQLVLY